MTALALRSVDVGGETTDVIVADGRIAAVGLGVEAPPRAEVVHGHGHVLLPGLWDHHIHLVALAAAKASTQMGPPRVTDADGLGASLRATARDRPPGTWIRAVGHHESAGGKLDRFELDRLVPDHPLRVQHRSGAMWILNTAAIERLGIDDDAPLGVERLDGGRLSGRVYGLDRWLRDRLPDASPPSLDSVGAELASRGVVGVTDATPYDTLADLDPILDAVRSGSLPQSVTVTGGAALAEATFPAELERGPVKILLADYSLPALDDVSMWIAQAHANDRAVAIHCVTREALVLALSAWSIAGSRRGDRVEHGAIIPPELRDLVRSAELTVVTQPNFIAERGDRYLVEVDPDDRPHLYLCASLVDVGIPVGGSTDAPFGHPDPWRAIAAAVDRRTASGRVIGEAERVHPARAIEMFLSSPATPGGGPRLVEVGAVADLCLLDRPAGAVYEDPAAVGVRATFVAGTVVHEAEL